VTARVSFADRARAAAAAAALAWIAAFALVGAAAGHGLTLVPVHPDPRWALAWTSLPWAAGFGLATWLTGRVLERRSWEELAWRPATIASATAPEAITTPSVAPPRSPRATPTRGRQPRSAQDR